MGHPRQGETVSLELRSTALQDGAFVELRDTNMLPRPLGANERFILDMLEANVEASIAVDVYAAVSYRAFSATELGSVSAPNTHYSLLVAPGGKYAVASFGHSGLDVYDVSNSETPVYLATYGSHNYSGLAFLGPTTLAGVIGNGSGNTIQFFDVTDFTNVILSAVYTSSNGSGVFIQSFASDGQRFAYAVDTNGSALEIVDGIDAYNPIQAAYYAGQTNVIGVAGATDGTGRLILFTSNGSGVAYTMLVVGGIPSVVGSLPNFEVGTSTMYWQQANIAQRTAAGINDGGYLTVVDITNFANPTLLGADLSPGAGGRGYCLLTPDGTIAIIGADGDGATYAINIVDAPNVIVEHTFPTNINSMALFGNLFYTLDNVPVLTVYALAYIVIGANTLLGSFNPSVGFHNVPSEGISLPLGQVPYAIASGAGTVHLVGSGRIVQDGQQMGRPSWQANLNP